MMILMGTGGFCLLSPHKLLTVCAWTLLTSFDIEIKQNSKLLDN